MGAPKQIVKIDKSLLEYFKMVMDFDNESEEYRKTTVKEFKEHVSGALNDATIATVEVWWTDSGNRKKNKELGQSTII